MLFGRQSSSALGHTWSLPSPLRLEYHAAILASVHTGTRQRIHQKFRFFWTIQAPPLDRKLDAKRVGALGQLKQNCHLRKSNDATRMVGNQKAQFAKTIGLAEDAFGTSRRQNEASDSPNAAKNRSQARECPKSAAPALINLRLQVQSLATRLLDDLTDI